jgi:hypothetical protein
MRAMTACRVLLLPMQIVLLAACAGAAADRAPLTGSSKTLTVRGEYDAVAIDQIDGMAIRDGRLALRGPQTTVAVDLPPAADAARPGRGWSLVTEAAGNSSRTVTFTHETTLDDFTLDLPASDAPLRYGTLGGRNGGEVLVFAWGENSKSFWGYVTIARK